MNRQLSRQGLFWHGPTGLLTPAADVRRLFVIHRPQFRNALRLRDGDQAFVGLSQFAKRKRPPKGAGASQAVAYLYMPDADAKKAQEMHRLAEDLPLVILAAGNPFRFARSESAALCAAVGTCPHGPGPLRHVCRRPPPPPQEYGVVV